MHIFRLFIYGTLKSNESEHHLLKNKYVSVKNAVVKGKLYLRSDDDVPYVTVAGKHILGRGSHDYLRDAALITKVTIPEDYKLLEDDTLVYGELFEFHEFNQLMQVIDLFEDFSPGYESDYDRVLYPVKTEDSDIFEPVWLYTIAGNHAEDDDILQSDGRYVGNLGIGSDSRE